MPIWNRKQTTLQESVKSEQLDITSLFSLPYYSFATQLTSLRGYTTKGIESSIKDAMLKDPIISRIINMWISDTLSPDILTGKVFNVEVTNNDNLKDDDIAKINDLITYLLENSNLDELLVQILFQVITNGIVSVRLGFVDAYEDTKIKLFESNKKRILKEADNLKDTKKLLEAPTYDDYEDEMYRKRTFNSKKIKRLLGRFYFEILPSRLVPLKHKGITILYLDLNNTTKVLNPRNITTFVNTRGGVKTLSLKDNPEDIVSTVYEIPLGQSFIENAVTPWSMMNTTEDCTLLALMTRSSIYRLFQVDVGALSTKETERLIQEFKKRITSRETIDVRAQHYSSAQTQIPLGDSIFVPTRNGVGSINVESIGGDLDIKTQVPLDYFREQLLASLGIPAVLIYGDESGSLINTSATRQDIRYLRTIQQFTSILSLGLEDIFKDYLTMLGVNLSKIILKVKFAHANSEEALQRIEFEQVRQEALDRTITSLNNLGIDFAEGRYKKTRDELIKRFMDTELLDIINSDEKDLANSAPIPPTNPEDIEHKPLPSGSADTLTDDIDLPGTDEFMPDEVENTDLPDTEPSELPTEPTEPDTSNPVNDNPPYSLG